MAKKTYIGVNGAAKQIKKAYVGIGGVAKKVKKAYIGIGGVAKLCYSEPIVWEKYSVVDVKRYEEIVEIGTFGVVFNSSSSWPYDDAYSLSNADGVYYLQNPSFLQGDAIAYAINYFKAGIYVLPKGQYPMYSEFVGRVGYTIQFKYKYTSREVLEHTKGSYIGKIESYNEAQYPDNGYQDGYWYVKI